MHRRQALRRVPMRCALRDQSQSVRMRSRARGGECSAEAHEESVEARFTVLVAVRSPLEEPRCAGRGGTAMPSRNAVGVGCLCCPAGSGGLKSGVSEA